MSTFRFLHLTDVHFGQKGMKNLWPQLESHFLDDLTLLAKAVGVWDAVFFTGDLTQRGDDAEFELVEEAIGLLWEHFATLGCSPYFVPVPGNHDLQRPANGSGDALLNLLELWDKPIVRDGFWGSDTDTRRKVVTQAFASYMKWRDGSRLPIPTLSPGELPGDMSCVLEKEGLRFGVVGMNSAFLQLDGSDFTGRIAIDARQANKACGGSLPRWATNNDVNFLLTHHPPDWCRPNSLGELYSEIHSPPDRFALHLFGHRHDADMTTLSKGGGARRNQLQGASLFGLEWYQDGKRQRAHGYSLCEVRAEDHEFELRVWPRKVVEKQGGGYRFDRDQSFDLREDDGGTYPIAIKSNRVVRSAIPPPGASPAIKEEVEMNLHRLFNLARGETDARDLHGRREYLEASIRVFESDPDNLRECIVGPIFLHPSWFRTRQAKARQSPDLDSARLKYLSARCTIRNHNIRILCRNAPRYREKIVPFLAIQERQTFVDDMLQNIDALWGNGRDVGPDICCHDLGFFRLDMIGDDQMVVATRRSAKTPVEGGVAYSSPSEITRERNIFDQTFDTLSNGQENELLVLESFIRDLWK